jgi:outer membrane protein
MTKTWIVAVCVLCAAAVMDQSVARAEGLRIGYVDMQRALNDTEDGKRAKARLKGIFDRKQKELDQKQTELKKMKEDLDRQRTLLDAPKIAAKEREMQEKFLGLQQLYLKHQKDLAEEEGKAMKGILQRMQGIIAAIAQAEGLGFIFEKTEANLLWAKSEFDLTSQLVRRYNAGEGKGGGTPKKK